MLSSSAHVSTKSLLYYHDTTPLYTQSLVTSNLLMMQDVQTGIQSGVLSKTSMYIMHTTN